ncbi:MAG: septal ring lytic transglycosylase RlpA family protein [Ignavibacteriaceae bacterium]|nr:septal ring lytic transglycosylase RlpA family protein [Ignavibacteriaceae bacterium]
MFKIEQVKNSNSITKYEVKLSAINKLFLFALLLVLAGFNIETNKVNKDSSFEDEIANGTFEFVNESEASIEFIEEKSGRVTWYGPGFHGNFTSSGEIYDQEDFTCAHRALPFGTVLRVTNLNNGKSVVVRVTDRGPVSTYFEIDLSKAAFREIEDLNAGVTTAKIERAVFKGEKIPVLSVN